MVINVGPALESALNQLAKKQGVSAETLAVMALQERFLPPLREPRDEWERELRALALDCGVSLSDEALSSEGLYD